MAWTIILILVFLSACIVKLLSPKKRPKKFPPGPKGVPLFGNAHQVGLTGYKTAMNMADTYGDVIGLEFGSYWLVILNNPDDIRETFGKHEFAWKYGFNGVVRENVKDVNYGVIMSYGKHWVEHRRFTLRTLRDFGFGKRSMETIIMEEVRELTQRLKSSCGTPLSTQHTFNAAVFNVIWSIVAGKRYEYNDPQLEELIQLLVHFVTKGFKGFQTFYFLFPALVTMKKYLPFLFPKGEVELFRQKVFKFLRAVIEEHKQNFHEGHSNDLIDSYLNEVMKNDDPQSSFHPNNIGGDTDLIATLLDLFIAGSETTSTTLTWAFYLLALHPESQDKLYKEIHSTVGNREVLLADRPKMPYTEATIAEIMRVSSLTPFGAPHATSEDVEFRGYHIPKNTLIFANLYASHHNPSIWGDPQNFRPERFLSDDGKTCTKNRAWMPFGTGKRQCMGESLARDELFLFFTNLVKDLRITMPDDEPKHSIEGVPGGILTPEPHRIVLIDRKY